MSLKLEFGLSPENPHVKLAWGARALWDAGTRQYDLLPDRQDLKSEGVEMTGSSTKEDRHALAGWISECLRTVVNDLLSNLDSDTDSNGTVSTTSAGLEIKALLRGGYLYLGVHPFGDKLLRHLLEASRNEEAIKQCRAVNPKKTSGTWRMHTRFGQKFSEIAYHVSYTAGGRVRNYEYTPMGRQVRELSKVDLGAWLAAVAKA